MEEEPHGDQETLPIPCFTIDKKLQRGTETLQEIFKEKKSEVIYLKVRSKRKIEIFLMVGAILLLIVGIPCGIYIANNYNRVVAGTYSYTQQETDTALHTGPIVEGDNDIGSEYRVASVNGTTTVTVTNESVSWDVVSEWDQITLTSTGTDNEIYFNWNQTPEKLMAGDNYQLRIKTNGTNALKLSVYAVKFDGVALTSVKAWDGLVSNLSQVIYWNWTPMEILAVQSRLNPDATDEVYIQIVMEGRTASNNLSVGDTIQFQFALGGSDNVFSCSSGFILRNSALLGGVFMIFIAMASTPIWNPMTEKGFGIGKDISRLKKMTNNRRRKKKR